MKIEGTARIIFIATCIFAAFSFLSTIYHYLISGDGFIAGFPFEFYRMYKYKLDGIPYYKYRWGKMNLIYDFSIAFVLAWVITRVKRNKVTYE